MFFWFQSTRPRGARLIQLARLASVVLFQSTRPRGARHDYFHIIALRFNVSIHAPTRGATPAASWLRCRRPVSIHAPTRGATGNRRNSQLHTLVSIHAPTRGATVCPSCGQTNYYCFNPRAHAGRDGAAGTMDSRLRGFQSTRPRGARHYTGGTLSIICSFNPRAHAGRDMNRKWDADCRMFQSTRPRGARLL